MKTLAIIGASYLQLPLVKKAKAMGLRTICFAWAEGAVCREIADTFFPISIVEKDEILAICQAEHIDGICTIASDVAAPTVAYVAEHMGLCGNSYETSLRANNKYLMRGAFVKHQIPCPHYQMISSLEQLQDDYHYPLIVKPADRSGSLGVARVENASEIREAARRALSVSFSHQAMVEQYIEGREISVECISYQGKHYPLAITDKVTTGAPHFVELAHHQPAQFSREEMSSIYALSIQTLDALGITHGASHAEMKITAEGQPYLMEVGARMGGDFIGSDLVMLSTGYDFLKGVIKAALGEFQPPVFSVNKCAGVYFLCKETESLSPVFKQSESYSNIIRKECFNTELTSVTCSADRSGYFIYQDSKRLEL